MFFLFSRISTWLLIEMIATFILAVLNMTIPILMVSTSYRNLPNFYFASTALPSSLINCLYLFYLFQTIRSKILSDINCRAIYYLQTSCLVVLAYTIAAMHANFVLCLFPSPSSSDEDHLLRRCLVSCSHSLRRFFRRFCFCFILCIWCISFTSTIPLLYTIDSNEKSPKPVYCPGTTQITYLEELFDRNRFKQIIIFYLIPLLISIFLSFIALSKLFYDCLSYFYLRLKISKCSPFRRQSFQSRPILSTEQTSQHWLLTSFLRFILVISCCLLACIYPIVMRFYLIYFSVLVPMIFAVFNYSLGYLTPTQQQTIIENHNLIVPMSENENRTNEQFELQAPFVVNLLNTPNESSPTPSSSSTIYATPQQTQRSFTRSKRKSFANHLYENTRNMFL